MLLPLAGNHYESSVFFVIGTGNKGNELIAVLGSHPCVVQTFFFIILDGIVVVCFVGSFDKAVKLKTVLVCVIYPFLKGGQYFIFALLIGRIKSDHRMLLPIAFVRIL